MATNLDVLTGGQVASAYKLPGDQTGGSYLNDWSALRDRVGNLQSEVADGHEVAREEELNRRTLAIALRDPHDLLADLSERGLSWSAIARLAGVSPTAVRKWRRGESITGDNRRKLAATIAVLDLIKAALSPLEDAPSWLEMPLADKSTVTALDVYAGGGASLLLDWASGRRTDTEMLDAFDPDWRINYSSDDRFAITMAEDGQPMIVEK